MRALPGSISRAVVAALLLALFAAPLASASAALAAPASASSFELELLVHSALFAI